MHSFSRSVAPMLWDRSPMRYGVSGVGRRLASISARPNPLDHTSTPLWETRADMPGIPACSRSDSRYRSNSEKVRLWAELRCPTAAMSPATVSATMNLCTSLSVLILDPCQRGLQGEPLQNDSRHRGSDVLH